MTRKAMMRNATMRKTMMRKGIGRFTVTGLLAALLLGACGMQTQEAPELIDPIAEVGYYLPAESGRIGNVWVLPGKVMPASYGQFFTTNTQINEICVEVGEHVEKGQTLAVADILSVTKQLKSLQEDLAYENDAWNYNKEISWLQIHLTELGGGKTAVLWENREYDEKLHEYRVEKLTQAISEYEELAEKGSLTADHAGRVIYVKDLGESTLATVNENIVVIADETEKWIQTETTLDNYHYGACEKKFIVREGEEIAVEELAYSGEEEILCQANNSYPYVRFACPQDCELKVGEDCPVFFLRKEYEDTIVVGQDALIRSEGRYYVYVQEENGRKTRKEVRVGERDQHYAQILEGLQEGDAVYYESSLLPPEDYEELTVEASDFSLINNSDTWEYGYDRTDVYNVPYDGMVMEVAVEKGDLVEKGQLLYTLRTDIRTASLKDAQTAVEKENKSYDKRYKELNKQIDEAKNVPGETGSAMRQMLVYQRMLLTRTHEHTISRLQEHYEDVEENNDGDGLISVYARDSGTVRLISTRPGQTSEIEKKAGEPFIVMTSGEPDKLVFMLKDSDSVIVYPHFAPGLWRSIHITGNEVLSTAEKSGKSTEEIKEAEAVCLEADGSCSSIEVSDKAAGVPYVATLEETKEAAMSYSRASGRQLEAFTVDLGEDFDWQNVPDRLVASFTCYALKQVIVIPDKAIYKEKDSAGMATGNYYVWLKKDGRLVQQFVLADLEHAGYKAVPVLYGLKPGDVIAY